MKRDAAGAAPEGSRRETWLWIAQRASAAVLALCVVVHIATVLVAVRGGLSAAEIVERVAGSGAWLAFYLLFLVAVAVHAPIGVRTVLRESTTLSAPALDAVSLVAALFVLLSGGQAVFALYGAAP